jgi:fructokinase
VRDAGRIAGVELGGSKAVAVLWEDGTVIDEVRVPTRGPEITLQSVVATLGRWWEAEPFAAIGLASFGPVTLDASTRDFGCIRTTPKAGWSGTAIIAPFARLFNCPIGIDTDVNGAALAEYRWGFGLGAESLVYLTIGTGVGGGVLAGGRPLHGRLHPELGHLLLRRQPGDTFPGHCAFHGDCVEGLLAGPALRARFGVDPSHVAADDPRWNRVIGDLAEFLAVVMHTLSPNRILVGGGVGMGAPWIVDRLPARLLPILGGYYPEVDECMLAAMITRPGLGDAAGPLGAIAIGLAALERSGDREESPCVRD